jgi:signal transduction histidine kinase
MSGSAITLRRDGWAAIVTWGVVSALVLYVIRTGDGSWSSRTLPAVALQLLYLAALLAVVGRSPGPPAPRTLQVLLAVQLLCALGLGVLLPVSFLPIYTIVWIAVVAHTVSAGAAHAGLVVVLAAWLAIGHFVWGDKGALINVALFGTFHYFALLSALARRRAETARLDAEALNRELRATQHLLAEATRQGERTRIARDLHDVLGHQITALTIHLQVAGRLATGEAKTHIDKCHELARQMLDDVRKTVSSMREATQVDFARALQLIVDNTPRLRIELRVDEGLRVDDVQVAESLLRCVQEAITNTLRHANASALFIRVWRETGHLNLEIHDDGNVAERWQTGNGLRGMRERVERINGKLVLERVREALQIRIHIPLVA